MTSEKLSPLTTNGDDMQNPWKDHEVLRLKNAAAYCGFSTTTLWRLEQVDPDFPKKIRFSPRCCGFLRRDLDRYLQTKVEG
jgi:prophage regulatory protein